MRAELLKIRSMPTPMWCLIALLICFVLGIAGVIKWGPGDDAGAADIAVGLPTLIAAVIFGVWMAGVEFGQNTLRQVLTADPRRGRLILAKLSVIVLVVGLVTAGLYLLSLPVYHLAASGHEGSITTEAVLRAGLSAVVSNLAFAIVGFAFALITASMAGGITMALVFIFVIDTVTSLIPWIENYAMGPALSDITENISGVDSGLFGESVSKATAQDVIVALAWLVGLVALGSLRFIRSEVK